MVAGGASYRETAEAIRVRAGRPLSSTPGRTPAKNKGKVGKVVSAANRHPQLVSGLGRGLRTDDLVELCAETLAGRGGDR